jgi:hypothetical protein
MPLVNRTGPNAIQRRWPYLLEMVLRDSVEERYRKAKQRAVIHRSVLLVVFIALQLVQGKGRVMALLPLTGVPFNVRHYWSLRNNRDRFFAKDAALRDLYADYQRQVATGTWSGPRRHSLLYLAAFPIGFQPVGLGVPAGVDLVSAIAMGMILGAVCLIGGTVLEKREVRARYL